jgi:hypothetical protein
LRICSLDPLLGGFDPARKIFYGLGRRHAAAAAHELRGIELP